MAAYAALVSLMYIIDQIKHHPRPPISLDQKQVESLTKKVTFLQEFLEDYSLNIGYSKEADGLESRIADAAYAAEDVIESHIVDQILAKSTSHGEEISSDEETSSDEEFISDEDISPGKEISSPEKISSGDEIASAEKISSGEETSSSKEISPPEKIIFGKEITLGAETSSSEEISSIEFYQNLEKVIQDIDLIKKEVMEIEEKMGVRDQLLRNSTPASSLRSSSTEQNSRMVGFDDLSLKIMEKLTRGQLDRQVIPIVGMGGIGKTTLARNIYTKPLIREHFHICAWATISQEYNTREILREVLRQINEKDMGNSSEEELGEKLYQCLLGRIYLIVMDDMWNIEAWNEVERFFPKKKNGSRIVITSRLSKLASQLNGSFDLEMRFLNEDESWTLFSKTVFGEESCPLELEEIGKNIVENCRGLPLSILVIGGLLAKSKHARQYWEQVARNLNSIVNSVDNDGCLKILHMSYKELPVYLKPCFLYMGVFQEDSVICVSMLIKLWVAEGFLKPISRKSLEVVAKEYLKDLIDRNLILVHKLGATGNIKYCKIHDLLRDLCLREAQKERFHNVISQQSLNAPQGMNTQRRIVITKSTSKKKVVDALQSMSLARSLICELEGALPSFNFRLLRIFKAHCRNKFIVKDNLFLHNRSLKEMVQLVNLRYFDAGGFGYKQFASSVCLLWNLQTLIYGCTLVTSAPAEIWNLTQLRHIEFRNLHLPDPPNCSGQDNVVLENLQTLKGIRNFKCSKEVVKRIPNIKKLQVSYHNEGSRNYCLDNLERLHKLESFNCYFQVILCGGFLKDLAFPHSLKKLTIGGRTVCWEDVLEKIGSLPLLEKLQLRSGSFKRRKWETVEGQFRNLKFLLISACRHLKYWTTESSHLPRLEHLVLYGIEKLKEIPSEIGEIPMLKSIKLEYCSDSAVISAKKLQEEQEALGNEGLQVRVFLRGKNKESKSLSSPNFQVEDWSPLRYKKNLELHGVGQSGGASGRGWQRIS